MGCDVTWDLKKSRGLFFDRTKEPRISYWANDRIVNTVAARGQTLPARLLDWDPLAASARSNCPMLHDQLTYLIDSCDPRWRARAQNIYAGRTVADDDLALTDKNARSGMVAISDTFTSIMFGYSAMYGIFLASLDDARTRTQAEARQIQQGLHREFEQIIDGYRANGLQALDGTFLTMFDKRGLKATEDVSQGAEQWALAHEISHHLTRDSSSRRDKDVQRILAEVFSQTSLRPLLADFPRAHLDEIEADLLATLILAGRFDVQGYHPARLLVALSGAAVGLITVAHLRDEWKTERADTHPGCADRLYILLTALCELYGNDVAMPGVPQTAHMTMNRHAATLLAYAQWAYGWEHGSDFPVTQPAQFPAYDDETSPRALIVSWATRLGLLADQAQAQRDAANSAAS
jgi:hypothetical protein